MEPITGIGKRLAESEVAREPYTAVYARRRHAELLFSQLPDGGAAVLLAWQSFDEGRLRAEQLAPLLLVPELVDSLREALRLVSTRILGRRTAPFQPFLIPYRAPRGFTPRS